MDVRMGGQREMFRGGSWDGGLYTSCTVIGERVSQPASRRVHASVGNNGVEMHSPLAALVR